MPLPLYDEAAARERYPRLFEPLALAGRRLRNRVVHASISTKMGRAQQVTPMLLNYYRSRAAGGTGMIVTENLATLPWHHVDYKINVFTAEGYDGLCRWAETVESLDCRLVAQLQDPGRGRHSPGRNVQAVGASALPDDLSWTVPHVLSTGEVERMIERFVEAARRLQEAGFSGVELSAGHGHLFHQFLSPWSNHRADRFGGTRENRTRLVRDICAGIRQICGSGFIVGLKLPGDDGVPGSIDPAEAGEIAALVADPACVDFVAFAQGSHARSLHMHLPDMNGPRAPYSDLTAALKPRVGGIPVMALGLITDAAQAEALLDGGVGELIGMGRPLITDPGWALKNATGREAAIRYCVSNNNCWATTAETGRPVACDNNPRVGMADELDWRPVPADKPRRIVVVGAGVAGMEAAWIAAARGHRVTVFGAGDEPGGKARLHADLPGGESLSSIYDYQTLEARRAGAALRLGRKADASDILDCTPDAVVIATGGTMLWPAMLPAELAEDGLLPDLRSLMSALAGQRGREPGTAILFDQDHGSGTYAAAERLSEIFERVVVLTPRERIAEAEPLVTRQGIYQRFAARGIAVRTLAEPHPDSRWVDGVMLVRDVLTGAVTEISDMVLFTYSTSRAPDDGLAAELAGAGIEVHVIGDAYAPRSLMVAVAEGHRLGNAL